jgi:hypothetical protein
MCYRRIVILSASIGTTLFRRTRRIRILPAVATFWSCLYGQKAGVNDWNDAKGKSYGTRLLDPELLDSQSDMY